MLTLCRLIADIVSSGSFRCIVGYFTFFNLTQVLEDELRSQQPKYDHCLESGIQILDKTPADSDHSSQINSRLDNMAKDWNRIENQIKVS